MTTGDDPLARPTQASASRNGCPGCWSSLRLLLLGGLLVVGGCGSRGFSIEDAVPDRSLVTGSLSNDRAVPADPTTLSDEVTIRNAVSSAVVETAEPPEQGWANAGTGSRGTIRSIEETRGNGTICRRFEATRENFEGVHLYRGETCLGQASQWLMRSFRRVE